MPTATTTTSRIAHWLLHVALITWLVLTLGCGAKKGGDTSLIPGRTLDDAGSAHDATTGGTVTKKDAAPPDRADAAIADASLPQVEAGPRPTLVSISVTPAQTLVAPAGKVTLKITGAYSDTTTLDVTGMAQLTSSDTKIATVAGNVVTAVSPGKVVIVAALEGLVAFSNITVGDAMVVSISLSPSPLSAYSGALFSSQVTATALMNDGSHVDVTDQVTWASSDSTMVLVSPSGQVQGLSPGAARITATLGQAKADVAVQVYGPALKRVTLVARPPVARPGDIVTVDVVALFDNGGSLSVTPAAVLESSNPAVLKVSGSGSGIAVGVGKTVVTVHLGDQSVGTVDVVVTNATLTGLEVLPAQLTIGFPNRGHLTANAVFSDQSRYDLTQLVSWSSDTFIVTAGQSDGSVIPNAIGSATVTAAYDSLTASAVVTVTAGSPVSLSITSGPISVANYAGFGMNASVNYADGSTLDATNAVTWFSDDPAVVSLITAPDTFGQFVAGHAGSTKVRAKLGALTSADANVTVLDLALLAIDLSEAHIYTSPGAIYGSITAMGTFQDGSQNDVTRSVVWKTGNPAIATISNDPSTVGQVTGVTTGTTSMTATLGNVSATSVVTVQ